MSAFADANASFSAYDVVFSGPSGQSTPVSLNLTFDGVATIYVSQAIASASLSIGTTLTGPGGTVTDGGALATDLASQTTTGSGLLSGWHGPNPLDVSTSSLLVDAGDIVTVGLSVAGNAQCGTIAFSRVSNCSLAYFRVDAFSFRPTGPVFNLPTGWTANSSDGSIVNNMFIIPEPGTGLLVIAGLLGLAGWRRGRA